MTIYFFQAIFEDFIFNNIPEIDLYSVKGYLWW